MLTMNFDPTHPQQIAANRRGEITGEQQNALKSESSIGWLALIMSFVFLPILFVAIMGVVWFPDRRRELPLWGYGIILAFFIVAFVVSAVPQAWRLFKALRVRGDLSVGQVEAAEGQMNWRRNQYVAETPARRLRLPPLSAGLRPGSYRFYFLPNTGWVLSAERIIPPGGEDPRAELLNVLTQAIGFSVEALEANRNGRLAGGQLLKLLLAAAGYSLSWGAMILAVSLFGGGMYFYAEADLQ